MKFPVWSVLPAALLAAGCAGEGTWTLETWGEAFVEEGIPADAFADGCEASFERLLVVVGDVALVDDAGEDAATLGAPVVIDLVRPGPHDVGSVAAPSGSWRQVRATVAPSAEAVAGNVDDAALAAVEDVSVVATGTLTCGARTVTFDWAFDTATTYTCDPDDLVIPAGGEGRTQLTVHADHLFYDSLHDPEADLRGQALVDADADEDGVLTAAELAAAPVAPTGYTVGPHAEVTDLWAYLSAQTRTLGHIDGEGHCAVR